MTEPTQQDPEREEAEYEDDEPRNPFDNPWFLPLMLGAFALWFGYDGFISDQFLDRPGTLWFNRIGFVVGAAAAAWLGVRARREGREGPRDA